MEKKNSTNICKR